MSRKLLVVIDNKKHAVELKLDDSEETVSFTELSSKVKSKLPNGIGNGELTYISGMDEDIEIEDSDEMNVFLNEFDDENGYDSDDEDTWPIIKIKYDASAIDRSNNSNNNISNSKLNGMVNDKKEKSDVNGDSSDDDDLVPNDLKSKSQSKSKEKETEKKNDEKAKAQSKMVLAPPFDVTSKNEKIHSAVLTWNTQNEDSKFNENDNNNNNNDNNNGYMFEIETNGEIIGRVSKNRIKLTNLKERTNYKFNIRTFDPRTENYSQWKSVQFRTLRNDKLPSIDQIPPPSPPKYLHVTSLYPTSCVLRWTHDNDNNTNNNNNGINMAQLMNRNRSINSNVDLDCEYFIKSIGNEYNNQIVSHTYNENMIQLNNLQANKTYKFVVISRYYDPNHDKTTNNGYPMSNYSNCVTITTPSEATKINSYVTTLKGPNEDEIEWETFDNCRKLRLFWNAPRTFYGNIHYFINDENNNSKRVSSRISKLPVTLILANNNKNGIENSIICQSSGKYNLSIHTQMEVPQNSSFGMNNKAGIVESNEQSEVEFEISENNDASWKDYIKLLVKVENGYKMSRILNENNIERGFAFINKYHCDIQDMFEKVQNRLGYGSEKMNQIITNGKFELCVIQYDNDNNNNNNENYNNFNNICNDGYKKLHSQKLFAISSLSSFISQHFNKKNEYDDSLGLMLEIMYDENNNGMNVSNNFGMNMINNDLSLPAPSSNGSSYQGTGSHYTYVNQNKGNSNKSNDVLGNFAQQFN